MTLAGGRATERADRQRERILAAARGCFVRDGFHAAAMADIAAAADISPGLIYRYFESKSALVRAIVDRQLEERRCALDRLGSADDLVEALLESFERWAQPSDGEAMSAALIVEIAAVAARDPELAAALRGADAAARGCFEAALRRGVPADEADGEATLRQRATVLHWLVDGLLMRALRQPDLDRDLLRASLSEVASWLYQPTR